MRVDMAELVTAAVGRQEATAVDPVNQIRAMEANAQEKSGGESQVANSGPKRLSVVADGNKLIYRIVDEVTGEVVRQLPSEEMIRVAHNLEDLVRSEQAKKNLDVQS